jgi:hypothetical protein
VIFIIKRTARSRARFMFFLLALALIDERKVDAAFPYVVRHVGERHEVCNIAAFGQGFRIVVEGLIRLDRQ